jgi:hypothetical protein
LEILAEQGGLGLTALGVLIAYGLATAWKLQRARAGDAALVRLPREHRALRTVDGDDAEAVDLS